MYLINISSKVLNISPFNECVLQKSLATYLGSSFSLKGIRTNHKLYYIHTRFIPTYLDLNVNQNLTIVLGHLPQGKGLRFGCTSYVTFLDLLVLQGVEVLFIQSLLTGFLLPLHH